MEKAVFRERARQRMQQHWSDSETDSDMTTVTANHDSFSVDVASSHPQTVTLQPDTGVSEELSSVLLPILGPLPNDTSVTIKGSGIQDASQKTKAEVAVKHYVQNAVEDREMAILTARRFREKAERLELENEKLKYEMNASLHRVRSFWRNKVAEGGTRTGKCIQKALH